MVNREPLDVVDIEFHESVFFFRLFLKHLLVKTS